MQSVIFGELKYFFGVDNDGSLKDRIRHVVKKVKPANTDRNTVTRLVLNWITHDQKKQCNWVTRCILHIPIRIQLEYGNIYLRHLYSHSI